MKSQILIWPWYPFSNFRLETGSCELIFVLSRSSKQKDVEIRRVQNKEKFSSFYGFKFSIFTEVRKYENKYRTKICDFTVFRFYLQLL